MSDTDTPRDDAGQFTSSESLYGEAKEQADAGFKPMFTSDNDPIEFAKPQEAADVLTAVREQDAGVVPIVVRDTNSGDVAPDNETMTPEQAAHLLTAYRNEQSLDFAKSLGSEFAAEIDKLRGDDTDAAHDGKPEIRAKPDKIDKGSTESEEAVSGDLDPELQRALNHPQVREAVEQEISKAAVAHQEYANAVNVAHNFAAASFVEHFPELAGLPMENLQQGLELLAQVNPERFNVAVSTLQRVANIQQEQQVLQQRRSEESRQKFDTYGKEQDARFREMVPQVSKETASEMIAYAADLGVSRDDLIDLLQTQPVMRHAAFQRMMYDAIQYRLVMKAKGQALKKPIPQVQRPGVSRGAGESENEAMGKLSARLASSGSLKDAQALRQAQYRKRS